MSKRIVKAKHFLGLLTNAEKNQQRVLLKTATDEQIKSLSEIVLNLLAGYIPISHKLRRDLSKHKDKIRGVADRKIKISTLKQRWNKFPIEVLENIIKITLKYLTNSGKI